jgi:hypothetical protein
VNLCSFGCCVLPIVLLAGLQPQAAAGAGIEWDARFGGAELDMAWAVEPTRDGGCIVGGSSSSGVDGDKTQDSRGGSDYWVVKLNGSGAKQWDARFGGDSWDGLSSLKQTADDGYILGGNSWSTASGDKTQGNQGQSDYWIVKVDSRGARQWDARFGGDGNDYLYGLVQTADGGFLLAGESASGANGDRSQDSRGAVDYWIVKTDSSGMKQWDARFGGSFEDHLTVFRATADGGFILGGYSESPAGGDKTENSRGGWDYWIVKIAANGARQWDARFGGFLVDQMYALRQTADGGYILGGTSASPVGGDKTQEPRQMLGTDYWIVKVATNGVKEWDARFGGPSDDSLVDLIQTGDGGYLLAGHTQSGAGGDKTQDSRGQFDYWIVKIAANAAFQWDARFGGDKTDQMCGVFQAADGGFVLGGRSYSGVTGDKTQDSRGQLDYWVVKLAPDGIWATAADLGGGWKGSDWFGTFYGALDPWIYHGEHGWMYVLGTSPADLWFWTSDLGWLWSGSAAYPFLYRADADAWLWYSRGTTNPRWFYNFRAGGWESH